MRVGGDHKGQKNKRQSIMFRISMLATGVAVTLSACGSSAGFDTTCVPNPLVGQDCNPDTTIVTDTGTGVVTVQSDLAANVSFDVSEIVLNGNEPVVLDSQGQPVTVPDTNDANDTLTITGGDFDGAGEYVRTPAADIGDYKAFTAVFDEQRVSYTAFYGKTPSGKMEVKMVGTGDYVGSGDFFAGFERDNTVTLPVNGNSNFTGQYAGIFTYINESGIATTAGDVFLEVEFQDNFRAKGGITNRRVISGDAPIQARVAERDAAGDLVYVNGEVSVVEVPFTDLPSITFSEANYSADGTFNGVASNLNNVGRALETGTYSAAMGGPDGSEAAGYFKVTSTLLDVRGSSTVNGAIGTQEIGVFTGLCVQGNPELICNR